MGAPVQPYYEQQVVRHRNDDGSESAATWMVAENTSTNIPINTPFRFRVRVAQTISNANQNLNKEFTLRYSLNSGSYSVIAAINATTAPVRFANSAYVSDGDSTTRQLTIGNGTFITGRIDNNNTTGLLAFSGTSYTELEFIIELYGPLLVVGDGVRLRVYETNGTALNNYSQTVLSNPSFGTTGSLVVAEKGLDRALALYQTPSIVTPFATAQGAGSVLLTWGVDPDYGVYD